MTRFYYYFIYCFSRIFQLRFYPFLHSSFFSFFSLCYLLSSSSSLLSPLPPFIHSCFLAFLLSFFPSFFLSFFPLFRLALDIRLTSILGYNSSSQIIYGVGWNNKVILQCSLTKCAGITREAWIHARQDTTLNLATEIPFIPVTGLSEIDATPSEALTITDDKRSVFWGGNML